MPIEEHLKDASTWAPSDLPPVTVAERALNRATFRRQRQTVGGGVLVALVATAFVCLVPHRASMPPPARVPVAFVAPTPAPAASPSPRPQLATNTPTRLTPHRHRPRRHRPLRVARLRERIPVEEPTLTAQYEDPDVIVIDQHPNPLEEKPHEL